MTDAWLILLFGLICLGLTAACWLLWRSRQNYARQLAALYRDVVEAAEAAAFGKRIVSKGAMPEIVELGGTINQLFDALTSKDAQMRQREVLFQNLANTLPEVVLVHRDRVIFANGIAAELVGLTSAQLVGREVTDLIRPAFRAMTRKTIARRLAGEQSNEPEKYEIQLISAQDRGYWVEASSTLIDYRGQPAILTVARDISYKKSIEATLGRSKQQAQITLESIGEGVITTDTQGLIDYVNGAAEKLMGTNRDFVVGKRLGDIVNLVDESDRRDLGDPVSRALTDRRRVSMGRRALLVSLEGDTELSIEMTASPIKGPDDELVGVVVIMHDVSETRGLTQQMSYQAAHDALTGLINRREFERRMEQSMRSVRDEDSSHVLCYLDLDRFKAVNDTCGHMAGDNMLREIASLIKEQVRDSDFVARLGGDEFGMLLIGCPLEKARQIADDVCNAVRDYRFVWQDKIFSVGVSVGLVEIGHESNSIKDLMAAADSACYVAKQEGRGRVHVYSAKDEAAARQRGEIHWLKLLQTALKENRFELFVQPILAVEGHVETGPAMEVLLRLVDEDGQLVLPQQFTKAAERYHLMTSVDRWVVQTTLAALGQGTIRLPDNRSCSINLSGQALGEDDFLEFVVDCLDRSQVAPERICFEMSESAVMSDLDLAERFVGVLHGMGCQFGVDDFGSGIGSLVKLQELAIDFLKIDGAYTHALGSDGLNYKVVSAITQLAKAVGFRVIAEQVEEQEDFDALRELGVDYIQGYFVNRPHRLGSPGSSRSVA
jgi:diguanylate cyclase (GGDEF)-like protein/PAS domain S-box-containing protein